MEPSAAEAAPEQLTMATSTDPAAKTADVHDDLESAKKLLVPEEPSYMEKICFKLNCWKCFCLCFVMECCSWAWCKAKCAKCAVCCAPCLACWKCLKCPWCKCVGWPKCSFKLPKCAFACAKFTCCKIRCTMPKCLLKCKKCFTCCKISICTWPKCVWGKCAFTCGTCSFKCPRFQCLLKCCRCCKPRCPKPCCNPCACCLACCEVERGCTCVFPSTRCGCGFACPMCPKPCAKCCGVCPCAWLMEAAEHAYWKIKTQGSLLACLLLYLMAPFKALMKIILIICRPVYKCLVKVFGPVLNVIRAGCKKVGVLLRTVCKPFEKVVHVLLAPLRLMATLSLKVVRVIMMPFKKIIELVVRLTPNPCARGAKVVSTPCRLVVEKVSKFFKRRTSPKEDLPAESSGAEPSTDPSDDKTSPKEDLPTKSSVASADEATGAES